MLILLPGHHKVFSKKIYLSGMKYDVNTSKTMFLSNISLKRTSKIIFSKYFRVCKTNKQKCFLKS